MEDRTTPKSTRGKRRRTDDTALDVDWCTSMSEDGHESPSSRVPWNFGTPAIDQSRMDDVREVRRRLQMVRQAKKSAIKRNFSSFLTDRSPSVSPTVLKPEKVERLIDPRVLIECEESLKMSCENLDNAIKAAKAAHRDKSKTSETTSTSSTHRSASQPPQDTAPREVALTQSVTDDNDNKLTNCTWDDSFDPTVVDAIAEVEKNYYSSQAATASTPIANTSACMKVTCDTAQSLFDDDDDYIFLAECLNKY